MDNYVAILKKTNNLDENLIEDFIIPNLTYSIIIKNKDTLEEIYTFSIDLSTISEKRNGIKIF